MAASANDLLIKTGEGTATTLSSPGYTIGNTSITVVSTTNWPTDTGVIFAIDTAEIVDGEQVQVPNTYCEFEGVVSGATSITSVSLVSGTPQNYAAGALTRVYIPLSSEVQNRMVDHNLEQHAQDGTHTDITATSLDSSTFVKADTISEHTADAGVTIDSFAIKDGSPKNWDGWITPDETWTYASASTFTVPGDQTAKYTAGTRLKFTQTTVKYAVVVSSSYGAPNTTVTIAVNTDFTIANAAITANYYSYAANPQGYPGYFNYTPTYTAFTLGNGTLSYAIFSLIGKTVHFRTRVILGTTSSVSGEIGLSLPLASNHPSVESGYAINGYALDAGVQSYPLVGYQSSSTVWRLRPITTGATYAGGSTAVSSTIPFTWGNGDSFSVEGVYDIA